MTATRTILKALADGKSRSSRELMDLTGLSRKTIAYAIMSLSRHDMLNSEPVQYRITPAGIERSKFEPASREEQRRREAERMRIKRAKNLAEGKALSSKTIVERAKASRAPIETAWSAL